MLNLSVGSREEIISHPTTNKRCQVQGAVAAQSPTSVRVCTSNGGSQTPCRVRGRRRPDLRSGIDVEESWPRGAGRRASPSQPGFRVSWQAYVKEVAQDEVDHVQFLQTALGGAAIKMPEINMCAASAPAVCSWHAVTAAPWEPSGGCRLPFYGSAHHV